MKTTMTLLENKPELLAPAGSIDSFHAAVDAGADAVYLGLDGFNARLRAKNFTVKMLSSLVPYAHARKRKIYITLNTLVKQAELERCVHLLYQLDQLRVDAVIVQDVGVADICRRAFPRLKIHASTQMAVHNSLGVLAARDLGIRRVVLARELTLAELTAIRRASPIELETFVHGALCYCFSGMCLASSFLGGFSGNRGRCTQVCRRPFQARENKGLFFSPADFCALQYLDRYKTIGIDSLKIEGRMKSEEYVYTVVSAYRKAIDDPASIPSLLDTIDFDLARKKIRFFLDGVKQEGIIDPSGHSGTGIPLGVIKWCSGQEIAVSAHIELFPGDSVRINPVSGFEGETYRIEYSTKREGQCRIGFKEPVQCGIGDMVYLTRRAASVKESADRGPIPEQTVTVQTFYPKVNELIGSYMPKKGHSHAPEKTHLTVIIDDPGWRGLIFPDLVDALVVSYEKSDVENHLLYDKLSEAWKGKMAVGFPPFMAEEDIGFWRTAAQSLMHKGIRRVMCANIGQWLLVDDAAALDADFWIWSFNRAAQKALFDRGVRHFSYSLEDDYPNIKNTASHQGMVTLFSYVPLFISRIKPGLPAREKCTDAFGNEFSVAEKHGVYFLLSRKPLCLFHKRKKIEEAGINSFAIDLRFCKPEKKLFKDLLRSYHQEIKVEDSSSFNFKQGIR